jgi:hypothetical protein
MIFRKIIPPVPEMNLCSLQYIFAPGLQNYQGAGWRLPGWIPAAAQLYF